MLIVSELLDVSGPIEISASPLPSPTGKMTESGSYLSEPETGLCGIPLDSGFILGGEDAKRGNYPFIAVLGYDMPDGNCAAPTLGITIKNVTLSIESNRMSFMQWGCLIQ